MVSIVKDSWSPKIEHGLIPHEKDWLKIALSRGAKVNIPACNITTFSFGEISYNKAQAADLY